MRLLVGWLKIINVNKFRLFSFVFILSAIIFFAFSFINGKTEVGIFLIFPFVKSSDIFGFIGAVFLFLSFLMFMFSFTSNFQKNFNKLGNESSDKKSRVKGGGIVFIGPIPIVFGSNWKIAIILLILAFLIVLVFILSDFSLL